MISTAEEVKIRIIDDEEGFKNLKDTWNDLLNRSNSNNIFLTWEWMHSWWDIYQEDKSLLIMIAEEANEVIGIAPFCIVKSRYFAIRPLRHIEFLGTTGPCAEYLDFILLKGREHELVNALLNRLNNIAKEWNVINLVSVHTNAVNLEVCRKYFKERKYKHYIYNEDFCPFIELPSSADEYYKSLSSNKRWKFRNRRKQLEQKYAAVFKELKNTDELENNFDTFMELYDKRWKDKGIEGSFSQNKNKFILFHKKIIKLLSDKHWLYFIFLKAKNKIVAAQYNFIYNNKIYYYAATFDPAWSGYSVGSVLQLMAIEDAIRKKISEFDFLRGTEEYKYYWTKKNHKTVDLVVWRSKSNYYIFRLERTIRRIIGTFIFPRLRFNLYRRFFAREEE
jgi:CelD/BcsL family acetyltransferase involved in cellulose biosynthesis